MNATYMKHAIPRLAREVRELKAASTSEAPNSIANDEDWQAYIAALESAILAARAIVSR